MRSSVHRPQGHIRGITHMRSLMLLAACAALVCAAVAPASAADVPRPAPYRNYAPSPNSYVQQNWTGFYAGINAGYGFGHGSSSADFGSGIGGFSNNENGSGFLGGAQIGYNYEFDNRLVAGIEADYDFASLGGSGSTSFMLGGFIPTNVNESAKLTSLGTVRGRLGYDWGGWLLYATGGWAFGHANVSGNASVAGFQIADYSDSRSVSGWVAGAGVEKYVMKDISVKAEYLHFDLGSFDTTAMALGTPVTIGHKLSDDVVRIGLNYHF